MRYAILTNDNWDAEENLFVDAVPALRQRAECEHAPLYSCNINIRTIRLNAPISA